MSRIAIKKFSAPDERRTFKAKGFADILNFDAGVVGRGVFEPGWKWSKHLQPIAGTKSCESAHSCYVVSGRMHIVMDDGEEVDIGPGDVVMVPPGHDAWTVGDEACVIVDFSGMEHYAEPRTEPRATEPPGAQPSH